MKLNDLLKDLFKENKTNTLPFEILLYNKELLLECDEFKNVDNLCIIKLPDVVDGKGNTIRSKTFKVGEEVTFGNKCFIHSISTAPENYNSHTKYRPLIELSDNELDKGKRNFVIRGIFDEIVINGQIYTQDIGEVDLDNQEYFIVMYFDNTTTDECGNLSISLDRRYLPNTMKESFIGKFKNRVNITKVELDDFLKYFENKK